MAQSLRRTRALLGLLAALASSCGREPDLVVYVSLDQIFSEELIADFERESGLAVRAEFDVEANKTVGLVRRIVEEKDHPHGDVYWNNEVAQTVRLAQMGLLEAYDSPAAADIPETFRDPERRWTGFAARARCLIVNTELVPDPSVVHGMWDLLDEAWAGQVGIARPLTGTTLTHAVATYQVLGEEAAERYWGTIAARQHDDRPPVNVTGGNGPVASLVAEGQLAWGWTDTDDYNVKREQGYPVACVFPDQEPGPGGEAPLGTLLVPNTVAILRGAAHPEAARRFVDWVLSRPVEERLAFSRSAQIPVRADVPRPEHVKSDFRAMQVSYNAVGMQIASRTQHLSDLFTR